MSSSGGLIVLLSVAGRSHRRADVIAVLSMSWLVAQEHSHRRYSRVDLMVPPM